MFLITFFSFFNKEKHEFQPNDLAVSKSLEASGRIFVYRKDLADTLVRTSVLALKHSVRLNNTFRLYYKKHILNYFLLQPRVHAKRRVL